MKCPICSEEMVMSIISGRPLAEFEFKVKKVRDAEWPDEVLGRRITEFVCKECDDSIKVVKEDFETYYLSKKE